MFIKIIVLVQLIKLVLSNENIIYNPDQYENAKISYQTTQTNRQQYYSTYNPPNQSKYPAYGYYTQNNNQQLPSTENESLRPSATTFFKPNRQVNSGQQQFYAYSPPINSQNNVSPNYSSTRLVNSQYPQYSKPTNYSPIYPELPVGQTAPPTNIPFANQSKNKQSYNSSFQQNDKNFSNSTNINDNSPVNSQIYNSSNNQTNNIQNDYSNIIPNISQNNQSFYSQASYSPQDSSYIFRQNFQKQNNYNRFAKAAEAIFGIGVRLQILLDLEDDLKDKNFLVSPFSTAITIGQLMLGAKGQFRLALAELLTTDPKQLEYIELCDKSQIDEQNLNNTRNITNVKAFKSLKTNVSNRNVKSFKSSPKNCEEVIASMDIHQQLGGLYRLFQQNETTENETHVLKTTGALFLQPGVRLNQLFEQSIRDVYNTTIQPANFTFDPLGTQNLINSWADRSTGGRIKELLAQPLPQTSVAVLANAIYYQGDWVEPFSEELSGEDQFYINPNKTTKVTYLRGQIKTGYVESPALNCRMLTLPYKKENLSMHIILPNPDNGKEYNISNFAAKLKVTDLFELHANSTTKYNVAIVLPKMSLSSTLSILDPLKKYYLYKQTLANITGFSSRSGNRKQPVTKEEKNDELNDKIETFKEIQKKINDSSPVVTNVTEDKGVIYLKGASDDPRFVLTDIVQQISLAVNEKGTEAAAITAGTIEYFGGVKTFVINRPFLFFIRHEITEVVLFMGSIYNPNQSN